jgi:hypothetical protein
MGPLAGQPIVTIAVPVIENGKVVMSLNATVTPATLQPLLFEQKTPDSWRAGIVDQQYRIITAAMTWPSWPASNCRPNCASRCHA